MGGHTNAFKWQEGVGHRPDSKTHKRIDIWVILCFLLIQKARLLLRVVEICINMPSGAPSDWLPVKTKDVSEHLSGIKEIFYPKMRTPLLFNLPVIQIHMTHIRNDTKKDPLKWSKSFKELCKRNRQKLKSVFTCFRVKPFHWIGWYSSQK